MGGGTYIPSKENVCFSPTTLQTKQVMLQLILTTSLLYMGVMCLPNGSFIPWTVRDILSCICTHHCSSVEESIADVRIWFSVFKDLQFV